MKIIINLVIVVIITAIGLSSGAVLLNQVPILDPPGWKTRLVIYLTKNSAETDPDSALQELRPDLYPVSVERLFDIVREAAIDLDWHIESIDHSRIGMHVIVTSALLGFKDDMKIRVMAKADEKSSLYVSAKSRTGRADFGANLGHILTLKRTIQQKVLNP